MTFVDETSPSVVAVLLDDLAPPRLGTLLRAARKQRSLTRREVAGRVGATANELRRYERGDAPVPPSLVAELAECYGEDLTAQFATRAPVDLDRRRLVVGTEVEPLDSGDDDDVLGTYVALVARVRHSQPGEPIALRADDLVALSSALGLEADRVEARIVELLGCTPREAHSLHAEMLRRKLVVPVAGFVAGLAIVTGVGVAHAASGAPAAPGSPAPQGVSRTAPGSTQDATAGPTVPPTTVEPAAATPAAPTTTVVPTPADDATPAAAPMPRPVVTPDTTPMSIPGNETVTIIQP